jgi:hypothetical protein
MMTHYVNGARTSAAYDPTRRAVMRAIAGLLVAPAWTLARGAASDVVPLNAPQPMTQLHVTSAGELLTVSVAGGLWQYANGRWTQRATQLDPGAPIASGHGRVAGRSARGTLWVLEDGRMSVSPGPALALYAGLQTLASGIIAIAHDGDRRAFAVRLEPVTSTGWAETARSTDPVLPDARPLQAFLDGPGRADDGHIVVLAGPDGERYRHGALGDETEATRVLYLERHGLESLRSLTLPAPHVFEDLAPRPISWRGGTGLLTVRSGPRGAQLAVVAASPDRRDALELVALGTPIGTSNRWLAPTTDGKRLLAVHTPHLGGVLHEYRAQGDLLSSRPLVTGVTNHVLGRRELDLAVWVGSVLLVPSQDRRQFRRFDAAAGWSERSGLALPTPVVATHPLRLDGHPGCVLLLEGGSLAWAAAPETAST